MIVTICSDNLEDIGSKINLDEEKNYVIALIEVGVIGLNKGLYRITSSLIHPEQTNPTRCIGIIPVSDSTTPHHIAPSNLVYYKLQFRNVNSSAFDFREIIGNKRITPTSFILRFHLIENNGLLQHLQ